MHLFMYTVLHLLHDVSHAPARHLHVLGHMSFLRRLQTGSRVRD